MGVRICIAIVLFVGGAITSHTPSVAASTTRLVSSGAPNTGTCIVTPCGSVVYAIGQAQDYDVISIAAGTYAENLTFTGRTLTLSGPASGPPAILDGGGSARVAMLVSSDVTLSYLTLQHGGGASFGAGILVQQNSVLTLDHSVITDNHATSTDHYSNGDGSPAGGAGIYIDYTSRATVSYSTILGNSATAASGATVSNFHGHGGGAYGGGIDVDGTLTLTGSTVANNSALGGPGIEVGVQSTAGGLAWGGGITVFPSNTTSVTTIATSLFVDNVATGGSGGLTHGLTDSAGTGGIAQGGGLVLNEAGSVANSTFFHNRAVGGTGGANFYHTYVGGTGGDAYSGALFANGTNNILIENVTIANNSAVGGAGGTGSSTGYPGKAYGGGTSSTGVPFRNTIFSDNLQGGNCSGSLTYALQDLQWPGQDCGAAPTTANPLFSGLANNGGPTQTLALPAGSPAIDAGLNTVCNDTVVRGVDQRLFPRFTASDAVCDIGAYEFTPGPTAARITALRAQRSPHGLIVRWRLADPTGVSGFVLFAGRHRLTRHPIPVHRARAYRALVRWPGSRRSLSLHVLLRNGRDVPIAMG